MEIIKEQICKTTYKGNCPMCGIEQTSIWANSVDMKCEQCQTDIFISKTKEDLIGTTIIDLNFDCGKIKSIILKRQDDSLIELEVESNWEEPPEFYYALVTKS